MFEANVDHESMIVVHDELQLGAQATAFADCWFRCSGLGFERGSSNFTTRIDAHTECACADTYSLAAAAMERTFR
ncbi:hypothetical protein [Micromonospora sp. NPDC047740]|uniref:hypothetical protein n=1 Tax=Micromonospora sp. NPDC047740 TaxID=3364254 RepID=UPI00371F6F24